MLPIEIFFSFVQHDDDGSPAHCHRAVRPELQRPNPDGQPEIVQVQPELRVLQQQGLLDLDRQRHLPLHRSVLAANAGLWRR